MGSGSWTTASFVNYATTRGYDTDGSVLTHKSFMKKCAIVSVISAVTFVITPSTETIYTMAVVNEITPDNIQAVGKTGKDVVDYITDQIDKVVNDKEENKK